ncbi:MAG TPA: TonB family protein [Bacteroidales bacterium]|nr:TonB family protein [Bacteroidales bacterium]
MEFMKKHKEGIIATLIFHGFVILILMLLGFTTPLPLPVEQGILLDFGGAGSGTTDPGPSSPASSDAQHNASSLHNTPVSGNLTQNSEEAPALPSSNNATTNQTSNNSNQTSRVPNMSNLFGGGSPGDGQGPGSGLPGNGGDGSTPGDGGGPGGVGGGVGNRGIVTKVEPQQRPDMFGTVVLNFYVDEYGNVSNITVASSNCAGCTELAKAALKKWKYEPKPGAKLQTGKVTFKFEQQ